MIKIDFSDIKKVLDKNLGKFGLEKYEYIMNAVRQGDVSQNRDFQRVFDGFYKVRRNAAWRKVFFDLFEEVRKNAPAVAGDPAASFDKVITALRQSTGNVEMSFSSKLLASVNKDLPIWDNRVARSLGLEEIKGSSREKKLACAMRVYRGMLRSYNAFLESDEGRAFIAEFDRLIPEEYREISAVKKLDFYLWAKEK